MEDVWEEYEKEELQEIEGSNRGEISSELYVTGTELDEIEEILGSSVDEAFDEYQETEFESSSKYQTMGRTGKKGSKVVLEASRDISTSTLIHESVHGLMLQPDARLNLPGNNFAEQDMYDEFVARLAQNEIEPFEVSEKQLEDLKNLQENYMAIREKYAGDQLTEEFTSLDKDIRAIDQMTDTAAQKELYRAREPYQMIREQVLAAEAAKRYKEEKENIDISEFINPDEKLYTDTVEYIRQVENDVLRREN